MILLRSILLLAVGLAVSGTSCSSAGRGTRRQSETSRDQYLIMAAELETTKQQYLYEAIRQLRPFWLTRPVNNQGGDDAIYVYIDDQRIGTMSALRRIPINVTDKVRYLGVTEAQVRFGPNNNGRVAIVVDSSKK